MEWSGQKHFVGSPEVTFEVDGSEAGKLKSYGPLTFLKVVVFLHVCVSFISVTFPLILNDAFSEKGKFSPPLEVSSML